MDGKEFDIHHRASFHYDSQSGLERMIKTALSVVLLIPGLLLATLKGISYASSIVRERHYRVKEHLTPINREIGSASDPVSDRRQLSQLLFEEGCRFDRNNRPTNALIIHGDGNLTINADLGILRFNPMKLILDGAKIVHEPNHGLDERLDDKMTGTGKWKFDFRRTAASANVISRSVASIDEALQVTAPRRSWTSCKRYHMVFTLATAH